MLNIFAFKWKDTMVSPLLKNVMHVKYFMVGEKSLAEYSFEAKSCLLPKKKKILK